MDKDYKKCTWQEFEELIKNMICSDFKWIIKPTDCPMDRKVLIDIIKEDIEMNKGKFPDKNTFIERVKV